MKDPLGVSPSKGNQGTTRSKEKIILTSMGIEPTTSRFPLLGLTFSGSFMGFPEHVNLHFRVYSRDPRTAKSPR